VDVRPGAVIGGKYRVERRLGAGGVGEVWAGEDPNGVKVAIKTLLPAASAHRELVTRFKREADFLSRIRSRYVAKVVDFLSDDAYGLVLVLEFIDGEPMNELLKRKTLTVEEAIDIAWDVLGGIADLHREQIIHRDLKPGNVILRKLASGRSNAVIVDFGMSRLTGVDQDGDEITALTRVDIAVGTLEYMAPEQILDSSGVTGAADIYALGAMMYRAVAGHHIFGELNDAVLARHKLINDAPLMPMTRTDPVARGFQAMVMRMLKRAPKDRYQRAEDVLEHLAVLRGGGIPQGLEQTVDEDKPKKPTEAAALPVPEGSGPSQPEQAQPPNQSSPVHAPMPSYVSLPQGSALSASLRSTSYDAATSAPTPKRTGLWIVALGVVIGGAAVAGMLYFKRGWLLPAPAASAVTEEPLPITSIAPPLRVLEPAVSAPEASDASAPLSDAGNRDSGTDAASPRAPVSAPPPPRTTPPPPPPASPAPLAPTQPTLRD
jgi:serine/threonine-protein kinase